jgi:protein FAM50
MGPENKRLFGYSSEAPTGVSPSDDPESSSVPQSGGAPVKPAPLASLEGFSDDPTFTKVVDRRWYQRNKHIYPASVWQEFDPEKDYRNEIRRDPGGNTFFYTG